MKDFLVFSKRMKLAEKVDSYITEKGINMDTFGVITTLSSLGLLNMSMPVFVLCKGETTMINGKYVLVQKTISNVADETETEELLVSDDIMDVLNELMNNLEIHKSWGGTVSK